MTVLVLGGTGEARELARRLADEGRPVLSSLAGRVERPRLPVGDVRLGGFGGADGLVRFLSEERVAVVVDATHPFAARISASAARACPAAGVPLLRLARPGWGGEADAGRWHWTDDLATAGAVAARLGDRVVLTTGRQGLPELVPALSHAAVLARVVDPVRDLLPEGWRVLLDRGPYTLEGERALLSGHRAGVLVTKDSGGEMTRPKLDAARQLGIEVVVVRRPAAEPGVDTVTDVQAALDWLEQLR